MAFGVHISHYMEDGFSLTGIGVRFRYTVIEQLRVEGVANYFFPKEMANIGGVSANASMLDFNVNAHYLFPVAERLTLYPLVGFGFLSMRFDASAGNLNVNTTSNHFIVNIGGGADIKIADNISINVEPRLLRTFDDLGGFTISAGVVFSF